MLLGHLDRAIYLTVDIFDTREISNPVNQPFVRDSRPFPDPSSGPKGNSSSHPVLETWFQRPHLKRSDRRAPWIYHCPIALVLATALGGQDVGAIAQAIAKAMEMSIPENHPILRGLRVSVETGGWLALDVQLTGVEAWLAEIEFEDPTVWPGSSGLLDQLPKTSTTTLDPQVLWVCQHHHARLARQQHRFSMANPSTANPSIANPSGLASEWALLGVFLETVDAIASPMHPLTAPQILKLAQNLASSSAERLDCQGPPPHQSTIHDAQSNLQTKTQQLLALLLVAGCHQKAPICL